MKRILVEYEVSDDLLETVYTELEDALEESDNSIKVIAYQTYEMDEICPDIMKRKEM